MNKKSETKNGMKRKKFFLYLGASAVGLYSAVANPFRLFAKKENKSRGAKLKVQQNPLAVKRNYKS